MVKREINVWQQTWALLCKNLLRKKRLKRDTLWELLYTAFILLCLSLFFELHDVYEFSSLSDVDLGRVDSFNDSTFVIAYTPVTPTTQEIMNRVSLVSYMTGREILAFPNKENMTEFISKHYDDAVGIIFSTAYSYHLKFMKGTRIPIIKEHQDHTAHCFRYEPAISCDLSAFWRHGFVALQAAINSAIIEVTTNHSVMEEMMSLTGKYIKIDSFIAQEGTTTDYFLFFMYYCFLPTYLLYLSWCYKRKEEDEGLYDSDGPSGLSILAVLGFALWRHCLHRDPFPDIRCIFRPICLYDWIYDDLQSLFLLWLISDLFVFLNECLTKEVFPHRLGGVLPHCFLRKSWIRSIIQIPSCVLGVASKFAKPFRFYAWNDPALALGL